MRKKQLFSYFILTFFLSWTFWCPLYFSEEVNEFWVLPGAWGPTLSAIIITFSYQGWQGVKGLFRKLFIWKIPFKYYLFSIFGMLSIAILSVVVFSVLGDKGIDYSSILTGMGLEQGQVATAFLLLPLFFLINTLLGGPIAEELGWRGFAQEKLQHFFSPNRSGMLIGFIWAIWHLPLIFFLPKAVSNIPLLLYIPLMTSLGVLFSWLYNNTRGSVLLAILFHGSFNFTIGFLGADIFNNQKLLLILIICTALGAMLLAMFNRIRKIETK